MPKRPLEEALDEGVQHRLQVGEADVLAHHHAFDLVEHGRVRHVRIDAIDAARRDHRQRRPLRAHAANLHRRGMRAQQPPVGKIKRIVHGPRRMILRNVQRFEIMKVILDLRSRGHLESGLREDPLDAQARARHGMHAAGLLTAARQGHIDGALGELRAPAPPARGECDASRARPGSPAFASLIRWPAAGRSAAESVPKLLSCSVSSPFLPKKRTRTSSRAARLADVSTSASACSTSAEQRIPLRPRL